MAKKKNDIDYSKITPSLVKQVKDVIADADKHTYSVSKVYTAHNAAFGLREQPQTCSSCLRNRTRNLRDWLKGYDEYSKANAPKPETQALVTNVRTKKVKSRAATKQGKAATLIPTQTTRNTTTRKANIKEVVEDLT